MPGNAGVGIVTAPASTEAPGKHPVVIAVPNEQVAGEQRVATVPEVVQKLTKAGHAKNVIVLKRGQGRGFAGIENDLFYRDNTRMLYGDAQETVGKLVQALKKL